jgi:ankyrin repeat protein
LYGFKEHAADSFVRSELVKLIGFLIEEGVDVNAPIEEGSTPFICCALYGEKELCKLLVERGANPTTKEKDGGTALHAAAYNGYVDVCRYLVEDCGLDIDAEFAECQDSSINQKTALFLAAHNDKIEVCRYLLEKGASVDAADQPLLIASQVILFFSFL